jgi:hypothetical protein
MDLIEIEKLLIKYEEAETTLKEEAILRTYFLTEKVPSHLKEYQHIFTYLAVSKEEVSTINQDFKLKTRNYRWISIAASIVLFIGVYGGHSEYKEYQKKNEALKSLAKITNGLKLVSANLNKGNQSFKTLFVYEDTLNKVLNIK